jgi:colanic acid biosynthesis glycosyl transferase WcaI
VASEPRLRILFIGINYEPEASGIAPYTAGMARGLAARGHDVRVVTSYPHYPQWSVLPGYDGRSMDEDLGGVAVRRVRHYVPERPVMSRRILMEVLFGARALLSRWRRPHVVVAVSPALVSSSMVARRARLGRTPVVTWVQDIYTLGVTQTGGSRLSRIVRAAEKNLLQGSARVVVIHDRFKAYLQRELGVTSDIDVVRNWSHVEPPPPFDRAAVRAKHGWADDEVVVLHAGNMGAKQGLENVVRASRVAADRGARVRFVLMGDGLRRADLEVLDPNPQLQFLEPLPDGDFEQALGAADVLLVNELPGLTEMSVPSKLTTYWATGRPVVAAVDTRSTTAEELTVSEAGVVVAPDEPALLVEEIEKLVVDDVRCAGLADAGRAFRERLLSEPAAIDGFEAVLRSVVE